MCKSIHYSIACQAIDVQITNQLSYIKRKTTAAMQNEYLADTGVNSFNIGYKEDVFDDNNESFDNDIFMDLAQSYLNELPDTNEHVSQLINNNYNYSFSFHNDNRVESNLLALIVGINAPNFSFKKIMDWAKDAFNTGY